MLRMNFPERKKQRKEKSVERQRDFFENMVKTGHSCKHNTFESVYEGKGWCRKEECKK